jgi:hypothetical protein
MKPESRPRCHGCYGTGTIQDYNLDMVCDGCDGTGFDPYWLGPDNQQKGNDMNIERTFEQAIDDEESLEWMQDEWTEQEDPLEVEPDAEQEDNDDE